MRLLGNALIVILVALAALAAPPMTRVQDALYSQAGKAWTGDVEIAWEQATAPDGSIVQPGTLRVSVRGGRLSIPLAAGVLYQVAYFENAKLIGRELWAVPVSDRPVRLTDLRTPVPLPGGDSGTTAQEALTGAVDGLNRRFTLGHTPTPGSLLIFRNGLAQTRGVDYTLSVSTVTFCEECTPQTGDVLLAWYRF